MDERTRPPTHPRARLVLAIVDDQHLVHSDDGLDVLQVHDDGPARLSGRSHGCLTFAHFPGEGAAQLQDRTGVGGSASCC